MILIIKLLSNLVDLRRCEVFPSKLEKLRKMQKRKERFVFVNMICAMKNSSIVVNFCNTYIVSKNIYTNCGQGQSE